MTSAPAGWYRDPDDESSWRWWNGSAWEEQRVAIRPVRQRLRLAPRWAWVLGVTGGFLVAVIALGIGRALVALGLFAMVTAIIALAGRAVVWLKSTMWKIATLAAGSVLLIGGAGAAAATDSLSPSPASLAQLPSGETSASRTPSPSPSPTPIVTTEELILTEEIPFDRQTQDDPNRDIGTTAVVTAGSAGVKTTTVEVTYVDGVETRRRVTREEITTAPVAEITANGTRRPPPPAPAPVTGGGNCHSSYTGACVPIASDVDCAGGSGNGPEYVRGPVKVVGPDVYDLDRDGDGIACDR